MQTRPRLLVLENVITCLPGPLKYHVTLRLSHINARAEMVGIVNKVYKLT